MEFIKNLYRDEVRDGWLVKSDMKKVWQRQLEIWQEVDRICRKHEITYWAAYGTLLGAARHKGFIPWDDDFDLMMLRPDYNRFYEVVEEELLQSGGVFEIERKVFSAIKIAHSQTTLLAAENIDKELPKGLVIDIFPLDIIPDGTRESFFAFNAINELVGTVFNYPAIVKHVQSGGKTINDWSVIETLHSIQDFYKQCNFLNIYAEGMFDCSSAVDWIEKVIFNRNPFPKQKSWYGETIYLPFETVQLPAPVGYDEVLTAYYGDWHKYVVDKTGKIGFLHSADIPYREFLQQIDLDFYRT